MFDIFILSFFLYAYLLKKQRPNDYIKSKVLTFAIIYGAFSTSVAIYMSPSAFIFYKGKYELLTQFEEEYLFPYSSVMFGGLVPVWGTYFYDVTFYRANTDPEGFVKKKKRRSFKKKCLNERDCSSYLNFLSKGKEYEEFFLIYKKYFSSLSVKTKCISRERYYKTLKKINIIAAQQHARLYINDSFLRKCKYAESFTLTYLIDTNQTSKIKKLISKTQSQYVISNLGLYIFNNHLSVNDTSSDKFKTLFNSYRKNCRRLYGNLNSYDKIRCDKFWNMKDI